MIKYVLTDIDGTLTRVDVSGGMEFSPLTHLENLVMEKYRIAREEALARITACGDLNMQCLSEFLGVLEIPEEKYFEVLRNDLSHHTVITEDSVIFIKMLKKKKIPLYTASTNSRFMSNVKLSLGGLADRNGTEYFAGYFAGNTFQDPKGKFSPRFFPDILRHGAFNPDCTLMIGDDLQHDFIPALESGIRYCVIVDRSQVEPIRKYNGGIFVNSLEVLAYYLENGNEWRREWDFYAVSYFFELELSLKYTVHFCLIVFYFV